MRDTQFSANGHDRGEELNGCGKMPIAWYLLQSHPMHFQIFTSQPRLLRQITGGLIVAGLAWGLTGCSSLPSDGPTQNQIETGSKPENQPPPYQLISITPQVVSALKTVESAKSESGLSTLAAPASPPKVEDLFRVTGMAGLPLPLRQTVTAGDVVNVTIYATGGGLFGPLVPGASAGGGASSGMGIGALPPEMVDESGQITVPYAGRIQATGRTPFEIEQDIISRLKTKAIDPQAVVTISSRKGGDLVTVTGDVKQPALVPVVPIGTRLLDALTAVGGSTGEPHDTTVTVIRGSQARSESLAAIFSDVHNNILLQPGDTIVVRSNPWSYLAFGALGRTGSFTFGSPDLNLADALAHTGGASDSRACPIVYVYRLEPTNFVQQIGGRPPKPSLPTTPVIYQLDLRTPQGFFLAQSFSVRNKDILYMSDSGSTAVMKFFDVVNAVTALPRAGVSTAGSVSTTFGN